MSEKKFYVYEHWRPDISQCFYVGKGYGRRANNLTKRNLHHKAIQIKLSRLGLAVEIKIIVQDLNECDAFAKEIERIAFWRNDGADLVNITNGGEGFGGTNKGIRHSPEHRAKVALARKGNKHALGVKRSPEYRAAQSARCMGRKASVETKEKMRLAKLGVKRSPEVCKQLSESHLARLEDPEIRKQVSDRLKPYWKLPPNSRANIKVE
jgi:hypothetical protein